MGVTGFASPDEMTYSPSPNGVAMRSGSRATSYGPVSSGASSKHTRPGLFCLSDTR